MPDTYEILKPAHKRAFNNGRVIVRNPIGIELALDVRVLSTAGPAGG